MFINFYADWCRFSNLLAPEWDKTADRAAQELGQPGKVVIGKIDCDKESESASWPRWDDIKMGDLELDRLPWKKKAACGDVETPMFATRSAIYIAIEYHFVGGDTKLQCDDA